MKTIALTLLLATGCASVHRAGKETVDAGNEVIRDYTQSQILLPVGVVLAVPFYAVGFSMEYFP